MTNFPPKAKFISTNGEGKQRATLEIILKYFVREGPAASQSPVQAQRFYPTWQNIFQMPYCDGTWRNSQEGVAVAKHRAFWWLADGPHAYLHRAMWERGSQAMFTGIQAPCIYLHFVFKNKHKITVVIKKKQRLRPGNFK